ncbi:unnamed protein product [Prorocentrum cordatum]|uniref:Uncharacterized protein n=1 Tax=Prorocentrum cordatum TaxID=2364126 RepID=A0ABN9TET1_9DINO|nr:unnamed protein product [Polarella glacialis]
MPDLRLRATRAGSRPLLAEAIAGSGFVRLAPGAARGRHGGHRDAGGAPGQCGLERGARSVCGQHACSARGQLWGDLRPDRARGGSRGFLPARVAPEPGAEAPSAAVRGGGCSCSRRGGGSCLSSAGCCQAPGMRRTSSPLIIVVNKVCESRKLESGMSGYLIEFIKQFEKVCSVRHQKLWAFESTSDPPGFLLKAQGPMKHDVLFKTITEEEKDDWNTFWLRDKLDAFKQWSYVIPLAATVDVDGQAWGVEPSSYLHNAGMRGKNFSITGDPSQDTAWLADHPNALRVSMERWEKMTIRLSEDVEQMLKYSKSSYKMRVTVLDAAEVEETSPLGKHTWRARGGNGHGVGLLLGGVTDYLGSLRGPSSDAVRACRFFLFITTRVAVPCKSWSHDESQPQHCVTDFGPIFEDVLGKLVSEADLAAAFARARLDGDMVGAVCEALEGSAAGESPFLRLEAGLLEHTAEQLEAGAACAGEEFRAPEHCRGAFAGYEGQQRVGCVTDVVLFEDISGPPGARGTTRCPPMSTGTGPGASAWRAGAPLGRRRRCPSPSRPSAAPAWRAGSRAWTRGPCGRPLASSGTSAGAPPGGPRPGASRAPGAPRRGSW